jgi:tetratricopeptide (TPR) repeat protein
MAVMFAIKTERPLPLSPPEPDFPASLRAVVARALEKEPEKRYADAAALLAAVLEAAPELAPGVRVVRASARRLVATVVLVAAGVFALGLGGWTAYQKRRAAADRTAARNLNEMGMTKQGAGDASGAEEMYRRAIDRDPRYARPYNNLGVLAAAAGNVAEADSMFRLAILLDPRYSVALVNLGDLYSDERPDSAEAFYRRAIQGDEPALAGNQLGHLLLRDGRLEEARTTLAAALPRAPNDAVRGALLRNLGKVEAARGDSTAARAHWQEAAHLLPNDDELRSLLSN